MKKSLLPDSVRVALVSFAFACLAICPNAVPITATVTAAAASAPKAKPASAAKPAADSFIQRLDSMRNGMAKQFSVAVTAWRFLDSNADGAEQPGFNDRAWRAVSLSPGFSWSNNKSESWLRATVAIPPSIAGLPTAGMPVRLELNAITGSANEYAKVDVHINGRLHDSMRGQYRYTVAPQWLAADKTFRVALKFPKGEKNELRFARLRFNPLPELDQYMDALTFLDALEKDGAGAGASALPEPEKTTVRRARDASEACVAFTKITAANLGEVRAQLAKAQAALQPAAAIARKYDLYYVGHGHIDMNWKWGWEETKDVAHRTWNSVLYLMEQFPEFNYPQSQPAIYAPIEEKFPEQFAAMKARVAEGRWNLVGGLWDESDTELPGGEALGRAFLLGQNYFKEKFGARATTGWLPDDFGLTGQLPQIMRLAGIKYFYHMRAGNGMQFTWWEAPDGSRVLKAWTKGYQEQPDAAQMAQPLENKPLLGIARGLVVYGVGDHGGGPTREQILRIKAFQENPVFPRVHFTTPDDMFRAVAADPAASALPVVDEPLQYVFTGCYTTHAGMKKLLRGAENALYTTEVLSTLASLAHAGPPYPLKALTDAWKPLAFSQFHDIAPGTAIRSTYKWVAGQLDPTLALARRQTDTALDALTALADTRGPAGAGPAIVVWNTLGFERDDVVRASISDAARYHAVVDGENHRLPAQADGPGTLVFVARNVPALGHRVYFPLQTQPASGNSTASDNSASTDDGLKTTDAADAITLQTPAFTLQIDKKTGAIKRFYSATAKWEIVDGATDANTFQLLGDNGSAWTIRYTGASKTLSTPDAKVTLLDTGPVFARVRVERAAGKSTFTQDITAYGALPRVDIPVTVDWHEKEQLLKIRLPLNITNPIARAQTSFAAIERPVDGQECPAQKWTDLAQKALAAGAEAVSGVKPVASLETQATGEAAAGAEAPTVNRKLETVNRGGEAAAPVDLTAAFNAGSAAAFAASGKGNAFPSRAFPAGLQRLGPDKIEFRLAEKNSPNNTVIARGQKIALPAYASEAGTLYLLGASSKGNAKTSLGLQFAGGKIERRAFNLNPLTGREGGGAKNTSVYVENTLALQLDAGDADDAKSADTAKSAKLWIVEIRLPKDVTHIILPEDPRVRLFAATVAAKPDASEHGLSILNDCKYGFDIQNNIYRLTALRTSDKPDVNTEQGVNQFTYSLYPHAGDWRSARTDEQALCLNIPLLAKVTAQHPPAGAQIPSIRVVNTGGKGNLIITALKQAEDAKGCILRFYEADGKDTQASVDFDRPVEVSEVNLLEDPIPAPPTVQPQAGAAHSFTLPVGHNQIITLRLQPK